jgi:hypothetical protein
MTDSVLFWSPHYVHMKLIDIDQITSRRIAFHPLWRNGVRGVGRVGCLHLHNGFSLSLSPLRSRTGTMYWRFDEDEMHVELDYPRDMSMWRDIGYNIDSAFQYKDGECPQVIIYWLMYGSRVKLGTINLRTICDVL